MTAVAEKPSDFDKPLPPPKHPAKFTPVILERIREVLDGRGITGFVLDPFAGVGGVHDLAAPGRITLGVELEPEWADAHPNTRVGDATNLDYLLSTSIDCVVTSPPYGNRLSDVDMRESAAVNYAKYLGRRSSEGSLNHVKWGPKFVTLLGKALAEMYRVLKPGGLLVLNFKDSYENYELRHADDIVVGLIQDYGFRVTSVLEVPVKGHTFGANRQRAEYESLIIAVKP